MKVQVREAVFSGLSDPNRKIRTLSVSHLKCLFDGYLFLRKQAHVLSVIANSDWPDEYPDLLTSLIGLLSSGSPDSVHGAIQVFTEFIKSDLTEDQILPVLRQLLPVLLSIIGSQVNRKSIYVTPILNHRSLILLPLALVLSPSSDNA